MYIYVLYMHICISYISGQMTIIPKPELRGFWGDSPTEPPFGVTSAEVVIICPDIYIYTCIMYIYIYICIMYIYIYYIYIYSIYKSIHPQAHPPVSRSQDLSNVGRDALWIQCNPAQLSNQHKA